jgi:hypothetical protein
VRKARLKKSASLDEPEEEEKRRFFFPLLFSPSSEMKKKNQRVGAVLMIYSALLRFQI